MLTTHIDTLVALQREHHNDLLHEAEMRRLSRAQRETDTGDQRADGANSEATRPGLWQRVWAAAVQTRTHEPLTR